MWIKIKHRISNPSLCFCKFLEGFFRCTGLDLRGSHIPLDISADFEALSPASVGHGSCPPCFVLPNWAWFLCACIHSAAVGHNRRKHLYQSLKGFNVQSVKFAEFWHFCHSFLPATYLKRAPDSFTYKHWQRLAGLCIMFIHVPDPDSALRGSIDSLVPFALPRRHLRQRPLYRHLCSLHLLPRQVLNMLETSLSTSHASLSSIISKALSTWPSFANASREG